jgi:secernin
MCDCLVALPSATSGATLFAKNSDRPPREIQLIERVESRLDVAPVQVTHIAIDPSPLPTIECVISRPTWCWGAEHGVNAAGVAIGNEAIYTTLDPRPLSPALIGMDLVRLVLERCESAAAGVALIGDLLDRYGQGGAGHSPEDGGKAYFSSFLIADPTEAFVVETSGSEYAVEQVTDVRAISNRTTIPAFDAVHRHPRQPVARLVDPRWQASQRVLAAQPVTIESLAAHLRSHDLCLEQGWSVCMHATNADGTLVEATTASMIAELPAGGAPRALMLTGWPCQKDYVEYGFDEPPER